jgi:hypothetical protein
MPVTYFPTDEERVHKHEMKDRRKYEEREKKRKKLSVQIDREKRKNVKI